MVLLEKRLKEKQATIDKKYDVPYFLKDIANSSSLTNYDFIFEPFSRIFGFEIINENIEEDIWKLIGVANLERIRLYKINISEDNLKMILANPNLRSLVINSSDFSDLHFELVKKRLYPFMIDLDFENTNISDKSTSNLSNQFAKSLTSLNFSNTLITDQTLLNISECTHLQFLHLSGNQITDEGIPFLRTDSNIDRIWLNNTLISDKSLDHISKMINLESLDLSNTNITDDGIKKLIKLINLEQLYLNNTNITDKCIPHLLEMNSIVIVNAYGTKISKKGYQNLYEGLQKLKKALPNCIIN